MSTVIFDYVNVSGTQFLSFGDNRTSQILEPAAGQLTLQSYTNTGSVSISSGSGGITIDATKGVGGTLSQSGAIALVAKSNSSWNVTSGDLALSTLTSGNFTVDAAGYFSLESIGGDSQIFVKGNGNSQGALTLKTWYNDGESDIDQAILQLNPTGSVVIVSKGSSSWTGSSHLDISVVNNLYLSTGNVGTTYLGQNAGAVSIGRAGITTTILGNLVVDGEYDVTSDQITLSSTQVAAISGGAVTAGAVKSAGGIGTTSNIIAQANGSTLVDESSTPILSVTQTAAGAGNFPVAYFNQASGSSSLFSLEVTSASGSATNTLVISSDPVNATQVGFLKITLTDNRVGGGGLATGAYYLPIFTVESST